MAHLHWTCEPQHDFHSFRCLSRHRHSACWLKSIVTTASISRSGKSHFLYTLNDHISPSYRWSFTGTWTVSGYSFHRPSCPPVVCSSHYVTSALLIMWPAHRCFAFDTYSAGSRGHIFYWLQYYYYSSTINITKIQLTQTWISHSSFCHRY